MSEKCTECGQVVSKAETLEEITAAIKKYASFYTWSYTYDDGGWQDVPNVGKVRVADRSDSLDDDPGYDTVAVYMVFEIQDGGFYRMDGERDSYDGTKWNGWMTKVQKQKREIWVYE